ncbi:MAG: PQQ-binding-like beta-propeller repeat protein [Pirellulales bacterium]
MMSLRYFLKSARSKMSCLALLVNCSLVAALPAADNAWPAFLGAGAKGVQADRLPVTWNPAQDTKWTATLDGHGQSSPVVWNDRVFVTSVEGPMKDKYHVTCLDVASGKTVWKQTIENSVPVGNSLYVSRSAPTPVVDGKQLVTLFESGDCAAWSHDGKQLWRRNLAKECGPFEAEFGLGASLCQSDKLCFALLEHKGPSCLVALDKQTGEVAWKADRSPRASWSSPAIITVDGNPQVVVSSVGSVDGYDCQTGKQLWTLTDVGGNSGVTPIDQGDGRFLIGASGGRGGEASEAAKKSNGLVEVKRDGASYTAKKVWFNEEASPSWASPIVHQGLAYWVNRVGVVYCIDMATGKTVYTQRTKQSCWATPLAVQDRIYLFGKEGLCTVIAAGREFNVLAENNLWAEALVNDELPVKQESTPEKQAGAAMFSGPTVYGYAIAGDKIIARLGKQLFCIGK